MTTKKLIMNLIGMAGIFAIMWRTTNMYLADFAETLTEEQNIALLFAFVTFMLGAKFERCMHEYFFHKNNEEE